MGNADVDLLARGSQEEVADKVIETIKSVGYDGGYVAGSSNSIPDYTSFENFITLLDTVKQYSS